jgi:hypothetical protein
LVMHLRHRPEQVIHRAVVAHLKTRATPGVVYLHPANGGFRSRAEASTMTSLGVVPGAPDLLLWHAGKNYAIELKADAGKLRESQADMLRRLSEAGVDTAVCHGLDEAIACLERWELLRGKAAIGTSPRCSAGSAAHS